MSENKIIITGLLLPKDRVSRNKVLYDWNSIKSNYKKLIGLPLLYNHLNEGDKKPIGKFIDSYLKENDDKDGIAGWYYKADVNPNSEYADSVVRGDLSKVSIQVMAENQRKEQASDGSSYTRAFISDVLEGSVVPTPGYMETSINIVKEQFNQSDMILSESFKVIKKKESARDIVAEIDGKKKILTVSGSGFRAVDEDGVTYINVKGEWQKEKFKIREYVEPINEEDVDNDELQMGIEVELEHTDDVDEAKTMALQHLAEIPDYYTRLVKMEKEAKEEKEQISTDNVPTQTKVVAKEYTDSDLEDAYQKLQSKDKVKKYILLRDLGKTHNDAINTIIRESFSAFDRLYEMFEADDKYKNMTVQQAKQILGDRSKWELENMKKALTKMRAINTEEEEQRLAAVRVMLKQKESFSSLDRLYESVCKENSAIIVKNGPNEYIILDDKNQQRGNVYKTISDAKKDAVKLGLKVKESLSEEGFKKISDNTGKKFGGYIKPSDKRIKSLDVGIGDIVSDGVKWYAIEESLSPLDKLHESVCKEKLERGTRVTVKLPSVKPFKGVIEDINENICTIRKSNGRVEDVNSLYVYEESLSSESVCKENSAIIVKNGPNEYIILDDKNQQRGNVYKTISDAKKDAVKLGLKVKESLSSESVCKEANMSNMSNYSQYLSFMYKLKNIKTKDSAPKKIFDNAELFASRNNPDSTVLRDHVKWGKLMDRQTFDDLAKKTKLINYLNSIQKFYIDGGYFDRLSDEEFKRYFKPGDVANSDAGRVRIRDWDSRQKRWEVEYLEGPGKGMITRMGKEELLLESLSKEGFKIGDEVTYNGMKAKITGYYANDEEYEILVNGQYMFVPISKLKK